MSASPDSQRRSAAPARPEHDWAAFEAELREQLRGVYSSHPWIVASEIVQAAASGAQQLLAAGAPSVLAVGAFMGVGEVDDSVAVHWLGHELSDSLMESIRRSESLLRDPPQSTLDAVDAFDPLGTARVRVDITFGEGMICGRPTFGARPPEWEQLEDKLLIQDLWAAAEITTAPTIDVALADFDAALRADAQLATAEGTVWAVDNRDGWHGGGHGTHWIADEAAARSALESLAATHRHVRIMPFVEGTPCSIHGMVIGDTTIAFRPMELMIYRDRPNRRLVYGKAASYWDPSPADREAMRSAALRLGAELYRRVDFQGVFTLDGIMSRDGFVPTEVNTRFGGALPGLISVIDGDPINLLLIHLAVVERVIEVDAALLEAWVTAQLDASRSCFGMLNTNNGPEAEMSMDVRRSDSGALVAREPSLGDDAEPDSMTLATVTWGARGDGGLMFIHGTEAVPVGPPSAPLVLDIARLADATWHVGLPDLEAARVVRAE